MINRPHNPNAHLEGLIANARDQVEHTSLPQGPKPDAIRGYELLREIHRGGQGVVYLAHQRATHRDVAIKVLRDGPFAGPGDRARFEREVQILASLKHPNIVAIHDSGSSSGSFYFVMDYIPGWPLDEWADALKANSENLKVSRGSTTGSRARHETLLTAFIKICDALNVAHQRGIIHRDLKPTNIRVTESDEPYVLDFGLAKLASSEASTVNATALTATGQFLGTLPWASPEQVVGTELHADIRTDVYALGLMLYRALTGRMPYEPGQSVPEMIRVITEVEPSRPRSLVKDLDFDLETIVLKCLSKDPDRRYQTVGQVAEDLRRYQRYEPIGARRESGWYLLRMFARRHRIAVAATGAFVALLICASVLLAYLYARARSGEKLAIQRAEETKRVAEFQASQLSDIDTAMMGSAVRRDLQRRVRKATIDKGGDEATVNQQLATLDQALAGVNFTDLALRTLDENVFEQALRAVDEQFAEQPLLQAELLQTLAGTMTTLGLLDRAQQPQQDALEIWRREYGNEHPTTLASINRMGELLRLRGQLDEARPYLQEALEGRRRVLGNDDPQTLGSITAMADMLQQLGQLDDALTLRRETLNMHRRVLGDEDIETIGATNNLGTLLYEMGRFDEAMSLLVEALEGRRRVAGEADPETLATISNVGHLLMQMGRLDEATPFFREALDTRRRVLGDEHPRTLNSINSMAELLLAKGQLEEATSLQREALVSYRQLLGTEHPDTLRSMNGMNSLLLIRGRLDDQMLNVREALESHRRVLGNQHTQTIIAINNMGNWIRLSGKPEEAIPFSSEVLETTRRVLGEEHPKTITAIANVGSLLKSVGRLDEAMPYMEESLEKANRILGEEHPKTLNVKYNMGAVLWSMERFEEALPHYRAALDGFRQVFGDEHPKTISTIISIGSVFKSTGRLDEALSHYREGLDGYRRVLGDEHAYTLRAVNVMGEVLQAQGQLDEALPYFQESLETGRRVLGDEHPETLRAVNNMGSLLTAMSRVDDAEPLLLEAAAGIEKLPPQHKLRGSVAQSMVSFYEAKHAAEPDAGYEAMAAKWGEQLKPHKP